MRTTLRLAFLLGLLVATASLSLGPGADVTYASNCPNPSYSCTSMHGKSCSEPHFCCYYSDEGWCDCSGGRYWCMF